MPADRPPLPAHPDLRDTPSPCPRCGYDVSGEVPTWTGSCPVEGRCSECGLVFRWSDRYRIESSAPKWLAEYGRWNPLRYVRTGLAGLRPKRTSRLISMEVPVRLRGCVRTLAVMLVVWYLLGLLSTLTDLFYRRQMSLFERLVWFTHEEGVFFEELSLLRIDFGTLALAGAMLIMPFTFLLLGTTLARATVRFVHLVRITTIQLTSVIAWQITYLTIATLCEIAYQLTHLVALEKFSDLLDAAVWPFLLVVLLWHVRFWWMAVKRYLKLPHAFWVSLLLTVLSFLGLVVSLVLLRS
jgi:hypothetical protein